MASNNGGALWQGTRGGLFLVVGVVVVIVLLLRRGETSGGTSVSYLPVQTWNTTKVQTWLESLGDWGADYKSKFAEHRINGRLLLQLGENELIAQLGIGNSLHRRTIMAETHRLNLLQEESPRDFFDYKKIYRRRSMFLLWSLKTFPRWVILYSYLYHFDDLAMPLYKIAVSDSKEAEELPLWLQAAMPLEEETSPGRWWQFWLWALLVPYYLILKFAWRFLDVNFITSCVVIADCTLLTLLEISHANWLLLNGGWKTLPKQCTLTGVGAIIAGIIFTILWPIIPFFVCDVAFYWYLYFGPFDAAIKLYKRIWP